MNPFKKIAQWVKDPNRFFNGLLLKLSPILPDRFFLSCMVKVRCGYWPNWKNPQTYNEKLQWLKLYNRRPEYTMMVDKYAVKDYVAKIIGEKYIIPTLGVWDRPEDIVWESLPNQFVLKTTHGGGSEGVVICRDKTTFDRHKAIDKLKQSLKQDISTTLREWPYKNVPRRIIAEQYIEGENHELEDYKVFCFDGEPRMIQVDYNRFKGHLRNLYTQDWERINASIGYPSDPNKEFAKPEVLDELKDLCRKLSFGIPHVRSDFYIVDDKLFFGELTFFHGSGFEQTIPKEFNKTMGDWLVLPGGGNLILKKGNICILVQFATRPTNDLPDYKFFCFDGMVKALFVGTERGTGNVKFDFFDADWNHLDLVQSHPMSGKEIAKPVNFEEMKELASRLSRGNPHVRVDLYNVNGKIYFGEMTFFHHGGVTPFHPQTWDYTFGSWIRLPKEKIK